LQAPNALPFSIQNRPKLARNESADVILRIVVDLPHCSAKNRAKPNDRKWTQTVTRLTSMARGTTPIARRANS
jgi:hypothetical protein